MTKEQIKNFREVLCFMVGPYAFLMPDEQVVAMRDAMQTRINSEAVREPEPEQEPKPEQVRQVTLTHRPFDKLEDRS